MSDPLFNESAAPAVAYQGIVNGRSRALRRSVSTTLQLLENGVLLRGGENSGTVVAWSLILCAAAVSSSGEDDASSPSAPSQQELIDVAASNLALRFSHGGATTFTFSTGATVGEVGGWANALQRVIGAPIPEGLTFFILCYRMTKFFVII